MWITSDGGGVAQYMFDDGLLRSRDLGSSSEGGLDTDIVRAAVVDQDNTLWFASPVGVFRYQLWAWLETDSRLDGMAVNDLLYDRSGGLWVATGGEGVQLRPGLYAHPTTSNPIGKRLALSRRRSGGRCRRSYLGRYLRRTGHVRRPHLVAPA